MSNSSQLSVAIHTLVFLAMYRAGRTTSELLALSVNTNASVIRRIMRKLTQAGLITSTLGTNANITLARPADQITLYDVHRAIIADKREELFMIHRPTNPACPIGSKVPDMLSGVYAQVQATMERELTGKTIADLASLIETQ